MGESSDQEKTEPATAKKREESREKGQVTISREVSSAAILIASLGVFYFAGGWMFSRLRDEMVEILGHLDSLGIGTTDTAHLMLSQVFLFMLQVMSPILIAVLVVGIGSYIAQIGFLFTGEPLVPDLKKMDPVGGIKRLFSLRSMVELLESVLKVLFIGIIAWDVARPALDDFAGLVHLGVVDILTYFGKETFKITFFICLGLVALAVADYAYQRWQQEKDLRMTKQEVKDEHKQTHGDPQIKGRIRRLQREMARRRMMTAVPTADVVITNPTHLAIALKFDANVMDAPVVVAKGAGEVARRIREIAKEHHVPLVEEKPLARALYKATDLGDSIPVELYKAVAEVLAYVYRLKGKR